MLFPWHLVINRMEYIAGWVFMFFLIWLLWEWCFTWLSSWFPMYVFILLLMWLGPLTDYGFLLSIYHWEAWKYCRKFLICDSRSIESILRLIESCKIWIVISCNYLIPYLYKQTLSKSKPKLMVCLVGWF